MTNMNFGMYRIIVIYDFYGYGLLNIFSNPYVTVLDGQ